MLSHTTENVPKVPIEINTAHRCETEGRGRWPKKYFLILHTKVLSILHAEVLIRTISMAQSHPCILCHATPPNPLFVPLLLNNFYVLSLIYIVVTANSIDKMHVTANAGNGSYYLRAAFVARIIIIWHTNHSIFNFD